MRCPIDYLDTRTPLCLMRMDRLSRVERRTCAVVARLDRPARLTEIAGEARMERSVVATYLTRLLRKGVIRAIGVAPRRRYVLADPVMAAWWWMRYRARPGEALPAHHRDAVMRAMRGAA